MATYKITLEKKDSKGKQEPKGTNTKQEPKGTNTIATFKMASKAQSSNTNYYL